MKRLYAPWRAAYVTNPRKRPRSCIFCVYKTKDQDVDHYILKRGTHNYIMMNLYPYNTGHVLIIPYRHTGKLYLLSSVVRTEMMELVALSTHIIQEALNAEGINVGLNLGKAAAGGSVPHHLHMHVLPRWTGDTNFLVPLADVKQVSHPINDIYKILQNAFAQ